MAPENQQDEKSFSERAREVRRKYPIPEALRAAINRVGQESCNKYYEHSEGPNQPEE